MIEKSIGTVRNLLKKRTTIKTLLENVINADDVLIISKENNQIQVSGHTFSDAMNIVLIGTALAISYKAAAKNSPELSFDEYINQVHRVAIKRTEELQ